MNYSIEQVPNGRWGIYENLKLLATIGCHQRGLKIITLLQKKQDILHHQQSDLSLTTTPESNSQAA
ncbi:MAG: hypothetical protein Tsb0014_42370 [Pleurocapsa sp.]